MKSFKQILLRELKRIIKSKDLVIICFIAPFVYFFALTYIYDAKNPKNIKLAVVDKDNSALSRDLTRMIDSTPELNISNYYPSTYAAYNAIFKNEADIFYYIPENFSSSLKSSKSAFGFIGANASNFMVSSAAIKTIVLTSQILSSQILAKFLMSKEIPKEVVKKMIQPIGMESKWLFNPQKSYANFFIPFIILAIFQQILIVAVCHTMSLETHEKTWKQLFDMSKGKILPVIFAKAIPYIFVSLFMILLFVFAVLPFTQIVYHSVTKIILISLIYSVLIVFFAMAISFLFKNPVVSLCALTFYSMPVLLISGFAWPIYMLPVYLHIATYLFPSTYFVNIFRFFVLADIPLEFAITPITHVVIFAVVCLIMNIFLFYIKKKTSN